MSIWAKTQSSGSSSTAGLPQQANAIGGVRKFGHQASGNVLSFGGAHGAAFQLKLQAESPFKSIWVALHNRNSTYPSGPWMVSAAATEHPGFATDAQFSQPIVGGTTYTALATSEATKHGYRVGTFGGMQQSPKIAPGTFSPEYRARLNITKPSATKHESSFNVIGSIISDRIDVRSVPATDGGRPWALMRLQMLDTNADAYGGGYGGPFNTYGRYDTQANTDTSIALRSLPYFRDYQGVSQNPSSGQNFVTDPSLLITKPADLQVWTAPNATVIFEYFVPTKNVLGIGDSTMETSPWAEIAFSQLSTVDKPINFINCGQSTNASFQFNLMLEAYAEIGIPITDVIMPCFSVNDYNPASGLNDYEANQVIFRLLDRIRYANRLGAKVWLWTSYNGRTGYGFSGQATHINTINNFFRAYSLANPNTCGLFDVEAAWIDGTGPTAYSKDGTHHNNLGTLAHAQVVVSAWR